VTNPSSKIASRRRVSPNLAAWRMRPRCRTSTSPPCAGAGVGPHQGGKSGPYPSRSPSSRARATAWLREVASSFR
jgi:hypothetical protein